MRLLRVLALLAVIVGLIALLAAIVNAEEAKTIGEVEALRMKLLMTERALIESQAQRLSDHFAAKGKELDALIEATAKDAGLALKDGWRPDPDQRRWRKEPQ